jgi:outer membrane protein TolC
MLMFLAESLRPSRCPALMSVGDCVRTALERAPAARAAAADVDVADARVRAAQAAYAPRLLAQAEYGRSAGYDTAVTDGGSTVARVTVETPLLDGGRRHAELAAARARLTSATALEQQRRADTVFVARTAYFSALAAGDEAATHAAAVAALRGYVALLQRLEVAGLVPRDDALRAELAVQSAQSAQRAAAAALDVAIAELRRLTDTMVVGADLVDPGDLSLETPAEAAIAASPVLADAQAAVAVARHEADVVRSEWRTHVDLTASGGFLGVTPEATFRNHGGGAFLVGFTVPIFDGGATAAHIAAAEATVARAAAGVEQAQQTVRSAVARAQIEARQAHADLTSWQDALPRAEEAFQIMRARYLGGGNVRLLEVLDALTQSVGARITVARARLAHRLAIATQDQILGRATP